MNVFVQNLPWRLASLAGIVVGVVAFAFGGVDVWTGIERIGIAFATFFAIGVLARVMLTVSSTSRLARSDRRGAARPTRASERPPAA